MYRASNTEVAGLSGANGHIVALYTIKYYLGNDQLCHEKAEKGKVLDRFEET